MNEPREEHPSYGSISFQRVTHGGSVSMYGSSIKHNNYVMMEISESVVQRSLSADWRHNRRFLLRARMSATQFADIITGFGQGGGHPITLEFVSGDEENRPDPPFTSKGEQFKVETDEFFLKVRKQINDLVQQANDLAIKPRMGAARQLAKDIGFLHQQITGNMDFLHEQFMRQMQRTVLEAKSEVDAHVANIISNTGLKQLRTPELPAGEGGG